MHKEKDFDGHFEQLTGHKPFPWQQALFSQFLQEKFPQSYDIPTGLGKTSIIAIWLLALAEQARVSSPVHFPRRLVYVVNRRTVVDQATREVEEMRKALGNKERLSKVIKSLQKLTASPSNIPLAISTLRGQFADNAEWRNDPSRPAVVVGTVDMIGSRLLFAGYGCGFRSRPLHAGFLGQDTLLIHDEAHLEPAFQELLTSIEEEQKQHEFSRFHVLALTATSRTQGESSPLTAADRNHEIVRQRLFAKKGIALHSIDDEKKMVEQIVKHALEHKDSGEAILIFLRRLDHLEKVADKLRKARQAIQTLTGTVRGFERDSLTEKDAIFSRFMPDPKCPPRPGTVYLLCTSAGEVGVNISADHLVCDLTPFDSMVQRFGRVNRFGTGDAQIDVVHHAPDKYKPTKDGSPTENQAEEKRQPAPSGGVSPPSKRGKRNKPLSPFDQACFQTLTLLQRLPQRKENQSYDASPAALSELPLDERLAAFTPPPLILPQSDILFDNWALTSIRQTLPGRPPVADWLHGIAEWEPPETHGAWRKEVEIIAGELTERYNPEELLEEYALKPHELLRDQPRRIFSHLEKLAELHPDLNVWLIDPESKVKVLSFSQLVEKDNQKKPLLNLASCTVLLPPIAGGLKNGMLRGEEPFDKTQRENYDVSDRWREENGTQHRCRFWDEHTRPQEMRLIRTIDTRPAAHHEMEEEDASSRRYWHWYIRPRLADDDGSRTAREPQTLKQHLQSAECFARAFVNKLGVDEPEATAVTLAARWHDLGKNRKLWQRSIGNHDPHQVLAKSGGKMRPFVLSGYRHEFGSLLELSHLPEFQTLAPQVQDLVLHLIAVHHGRARPHFPTNEAFDPKYPEKISLRAANKVPRRFALLQRKYGRWGLAYLESLVRAADILASQPTTAEETNTMDTNPPTQEVR